MSKMFKTRFGALCMALILVFSMAVSASAAEGDFTIENGVLTKYNGPGGDVVIPDGVTSIGDYAFSDCTNLTSVTIPDSVTSIGGGPFWGCNNLASVTIPDSVTSIGDHAFDNTPWLEEQCKNNDFVIVGNSVLLKYAGSAGNLVIPDGVTSIGGGAFYACENLISVAIPNTVTEIGESAFYYCHNLTSVIIPDSVKKIGNDAFGECPKLNDLTIPASVTEMGKEIISFEAPDKRDQLPYGFRIHGVAGSYVEKWVKEYNEKNNKYNLDSFEGDIIQFIADGGAGSGDINPPSSFTITFDTEGKTETAVTGTDGKLTALPTPTRDGYSFQGWYTAKDGGTQVTTDTVFRADTTVYAHWEQKDSGQTDNNPGGSSGGNSGDNPDSNPGGSSGDNPGSNLGGSSGSNPGSSSGGNPSSGSSYAVSAGQSDYGSVTVNPQNAARGAKITVTVTPEPGYILDTLTVTDSMGNKLNLVQQAENQYTFQMPNGKVDVNASFVKKVESGGSGESVGTTGLSSEEFSDLVSGMWYQEAVDYVLSNGLMQGFGDGRFGPYETLSRAELAQILYNKEGKPSSNVKNPFLDVSGSSWYANAVLWANAKGVVRGNGNGLFAPENPITREQIIVMLWRYAGSPSTANRALNFQDANEVSSFAKEALCWAVGRGIIAGTSNGSLNPKGMASRVEVAQMLMRFLENGQS